MSKVVMKFLELIHVLCADLAIESDDWEKLVQYN